MGDEYDGIQMERKEHGYVSGHGTNSITYARCGLSIAWPLP